MCGPERVWPPWVAPPEVTLPSRPLAPAPAPHLPGWQARAGCKPLVIPPCRVSWSPCALTEVPTAAGLREHLACATVGLPPFLGVAGPGLAPSLPLAVALPFLRSPLAPMAGRGEGRRSPLPAPLCPRQSYWPSHHSFCLSKFCPHDFKTVTTRRFETFRLSAACHGVAGSQSAGWGVPARVVGGASALGEPRARLADPGVTCGSPQPPRRPGPARP